MGPCLPDDVKQKLHQLLSERQINKYTINISPGAKKGDNFCGHIYRVQISGENETLQLIIKVALRDDKFREVVPIEQYYRREYYMYQFVLPRFSRLKSEVFYPKIFTASCDVKREFIIMQDLGNSYKLFDRRATLDMPHCELFMKTIAKLHALSIALKVKDLQKFKEFKKNTSEFFLRSIDIDSLKASGQKLYSINDECFKNEEPIIWNKMNKFASNVIDELLRLSSEEINDDLSVITHGDCWSNNFLFSYGNESNPLQPTDLCLIDFQESRFASPVWDLSTFMCCSMDYKTLVNSFDNLIKLYHSSVIKILESVEIENASQIFPASKLDEHLQVFFKCGLAFSLQQIPVLCHDENNIGIEDAIKQQESANDNFLTALDKCCAENQGDALIMERMAGVIRFSAERNFI